MEIIMHVITITEAKNKFYHLIEKVNLSHKPIIITSKKGNAVLISENDWKAIQETLYLLIIPGMREYIKGRMAIPVEQCSEELN